MKHPSSAKVFEFVEKLEAAVGRCGGDRCNMRQFEVEPECGTPGCHGGWAAIALGVKTEIYGPGADELAEFLLGEQAHRFSLCEWAAENPEIWGNVHGYDMWGMGAAFSRKSNRFPVSVLIDHWRGVGERLSALESAS